MDAEWNGIAGSLGDPSAGTDGGRPSRDSMFLAARLTVANEEPRDVRIRNLSERGLMAELNRPVEPGTPVALEFRGIGRVTGRIAWYAEGRAGVALDEEIDPTRARRPVGGRAGANGAGGIGRR